MDLPFNKNAMIERRIPLYTIKVGIITVHIIQVTLDEWPARYEGSMYITTTSDIGTLVVHNEVFVKSFAFVVSDFHYFDGHGITESLRQRILSEIGTTWSLDKIKR